jgi:hypothetical protein
MSLRKWRVSQRGGTTVDPSFSTWRTISHDHLNRIPRWVPFFVVALAATVGGCGDGNPTKPVNHSPVISSVLVFPQAIGPSDSFIVICKAADLDADTLVYDWTTDDRLRIQGAFTGNSYLYNTRSNARVFYNANLMNPMSDSAWVECVTRDGRGGQDGRLVYITLHP